MKVYNIKKVTAGGRHAWVRTSQGLLRKPLTAFAGKALEIVEQEPNYAQMQGGSGAGGNPPHYAGGSGGGWAPPVSPAKLMVPVAKEPKHPFRVSFRTKPNPDLHVWQVGMRIYQNPAVWGFRPTLAVFCFNLHRKPTDGWLASRGAHYRGFLWEWSWRGWLVVRSFRNPLRRWVGPSVFALPVRIKF